MYLNKREIQKLFFILLMVRKKMLHPVCFHFSLSLHFTVICIVFRPDGVELAVSSLDGQLSFWNVANAVQTGSIEGRHDLEVGRREWDKVTAKTLTGGMYGRPS